MNNDTLNLLYFKNQYLDVPLDILVLDLYTFTLYSLQRPPRGQTADFNVRIEILTLKNYFYLCMKAYYCVTSSFLLLVLKT